MLISTLVQVIRKLDLKGSTVDTKLVSEEVYQIQTSRTEVSQSTSYRARGAEGGKGQGIPGGICRGARRCQNPDLLSARTGQKHASRGDTARRE